MRLLLNVCIDLSIQHKLISTKDKIIDVQKQHKELHEVDNRDITQEFDYR